MLRRSLTDAVEKVGGESLMPVCWLDLASVGLIGTFCRGPCGPRPRRSRHQLTRRNSRAGVLWRRPDEAQGQHLEVLHDRGEMELITDT